MCIIWNQNIASLYKHMGKLQSAITLIQWCESKISTVKYQVLIHSVCPCKNFAPKCSQTPDKLDWLFVFFFSNNTLIRKKKLVQISSYRRARFIALSGISVAMCIVEPYNASKLPTVLFWANRVKVVNVICACNTGIPCFSHARAHKMYGFPVQTWEIL